MPFLYCIFGHYPSMGIVTIAMEPSHLILEKLDLHQTIFHWLLNHSLPFNSSETLLHFLFLTAFLHNLHQHCLDYHSVQGLGVAPLSTACQEQLWHVVSMATGHTFGAFVPQLVTMATRFLDI